MPAADSTAPSATIVLRSSRDSSRSSATLSNSSTRSPQNGQTRSLERT
jgi:hypothetical protein